AALAEPPDQRVEVPPRVVVALEKRRGLAGMVDRLHEMPPLSTSARCTKRTSSPRRRAQPCRCIRHEVSGETTHRAPLAPIRSSLSAPIAAETASSVTEKVP